MASAIPPDEITLMRELLGSGYRARYDVSLEFAHRHRDPSLAEAYRVLDAMRDRGLLTTVRRPVRDATVFVALYDPDSWAPGC